MRFVLTLALIVISLSLRAENPPTYGPFIEKDFPFISSGLDLRQGDKESGNVVIRGILLQLGDGVWACFDTATLRMAALWHGGDITMGTMAMSSYPDTGKKTDAFPKVNGTIDFISEPTIGVTVEGKPFEDPRASVAHALPEKVGRWEGLYTTPAGVTMVYTLSGQKIMERVVGYRSGEAPAYIRSFNFGKELAAPLRILLFQREGVGGLTIEELGSYLVHHGENGTAHVAIGVGELEIDQAGRVIWVVPAGVANASVGMSRDPIGEMPQGHPGAVKRWKESVKTDWKPERGSGAYAVDQLMLPIPNPWHRSIRVAALDFFDEQKAAAVTFDGDVWILDGIDKPEVKWTRFASGLYSPQSLLIRDGKILVFGRDRITRLHDQNRDGEADFYENFSDAFTQAFRTREFALDMVNGPDGSVYLAKGGIQVTTKPSGVGVSPHSGGIVKISKDGRTGELIADGLREPFIGYNPDKDALYANDQQGHFVPSTPVTRVQQGDYFGHEPTNFRNKDKITAPSAWVPHSVDNSPAGMVYVDSDKMGPLSKAMVITSYGKQGILKYFEGKGYAGVSPVKLRTGFPLLKGVMGTGPQLYVSGFKVWSSTAQEVSGIGRIRYTGHPTSIPVSVHVYRQGVELVFDPVLSAESVSNLGNYEIGRWKYQRTKNYGSPFFRMNDEPGKEMIGSLLATPTKDGKGLFLAIPGMKPVEQFALTYALKSRSGTPIENGVYMSIHELVDLPDSHESYEQIVSMSFEKAIDVSSQKEAVEVTVASGKELVEKYACIVCHSVDGSKDGKIGPTFKSLFGSVREFKDGTRAKADEAYIEKSLLKPEADVVKGYEVAMGSYTGILSEDEIAAITLYLKSLSE